MNRLISIVNDYRVILVNVFASFVVKGGSLVITLLTIPAYLRYFNDNVVLGVWYTMLSLLSAVRTLDIGIGNGLRNKLTTAIALKDSSKAKTLISSAYVIMSIFACMVAMVATFVFRHIPWSTVLNVPSTSIDAAVLAESMTILFVGIMLYMILKLITSILYSLQRSAVINAMDLLSSVLILIYLFYAEDKGADSNMIRMSWINVAAVNIPMLVATVVIFRTSLKNERPSVRCYDSKVASSIFASGMCFFYLQILFMVVSSLNEYLISCLSGPEYAVNYQVYHKIFGLVSGLFALAMLPVWSAITKAKAEGKFEWIIRLYRILQILVLVVVLLTLCIVPFMQPIVDVWLQEETIQVDVISALTFCIANAMFIWHNVNTSIANGMTYLRPQMIFMTIGGILNIPLAYVLVMCTGQWYMVMMANIIALLPLSIAQPVMVNRLLRRKMSESEGCSPCREPEKREQLAISQ